MGTFFIENWFIGWILLELNTITFLGILAPTTYKSFFKEAPLNYFIAQRISSIFLVFSLYILLFLKSFFFTNIIFVRALFFKIAIFPFQGWLILIVPRISWLFFFIIITFQKIIPFIFIELRKLEINNLLMASILGTIFFGRLRNRLANNLKSLILFSRISNTRWLMIRTLIRTKIWKLFFIIYFIFLGFIFLQELKNTTYSKITFFSLIGVAGLPPLAGFFPKILIIIYLTNINIKIFLILLLLSSVLDFYFYTRLSYKALISLKTNLKLKKNSRPRINQFFILLACCFPLIF